MVRAAVLAVAGVVDLHPGPFGEVATLLPGRRVRGVRLTDGSDAGGVSEVHVVVDTSAPVTSTAAAVHVALSRLGLARVHVVIGDVRTTAHDEAGDPTGS